MIGVSWRMLALLLLGLLTPGLWAPAAASTSRVIDSATGAGLAGAIVTSGTRAVVTDTDGSFPLDEPVGGPILVRAPGYRAKNVDLALLADDQGTVRLQPLTIKALYLSIYGIGYKPLREEVLRRLAEGGFNALVIDLKSDGGLVDYPSAVPLATEIGARRVTTIQDLRALVTHLHGLGIYAIARIVVFKDELLAKAKPELAVRTADGSVYRDHENLAWVDPFRQEVRDYDVAIAVEAAQAGFDEIQFDYMRFPDSPRVRFAAGSTQADRVGAITALLAQARQQLTPYNVFLSADIFGYVCWNTDDTKIGQRLEDLLPWVDYLSPMLYPSAFQDGIPGVSDPVANVEQIVRRSLEHAIARTGASPRRFRPWLQAFRDYAFDRRDFDDDEFAEQVRAAESQGVDGWMLWNPRNVYPVRMLPAEP